MTVLRGTEVTSILTDLQVSILVPVYNPGPYLSRCLDSLLAQTLPDWECLLVDDGSTDGSSTVCDEYAKKDCRFRVIHQKNSGASAARNAALDAASAPFLLMLDADDCLAENTLESLLKLQKENPQAFLFFSFTETPELLGKPPEPDCLRSYQAKDVGRLILDTPFPTPWGKLYRRDLLEKRALRFDTSLSCYEDRPFIRDYLRVFFEEVPDAFCLYYNCPLYFYETGNEHSLSKSDRSQLSPAIYEIFDRQLTDCLDFYKVPPEDLFLLVREYLNTLLYCAWCCPSKQRKSQMRTFYKSKEYRHLMDYFRQNHFYEARFLPLRFHLTNLAVALDQSRLGSCWLYWKFHWLGLYTLCRGWKPI